MVLRDAYKQDVIIAKNYLVEDEIDTLNRVVVIFLEQAELRVKQQQDLTLSFWQKNVDRLLEFNDQPILDGPGSISHEAMKKVVHDRYDTFDGNRKIAEAIAADADDLKALEQLKDELKQNKDKPAEDELES